jgi:hypothetical protein
MRALGSGLITMLSIWILTGCPAKEAFLRPEKPPENLAGPPVTDSRYDKPPAYPADAMAKKTKGFDPNDPNAQQQPAMGMGQMGGMGQGGSGAGFGPGGR